MKNLILFCFILMVPVFGKAQNYSSDEIQVMDLVQSVFDDIFSTLDSTALDKYFVKEFILLEHGEIWTNATIKTYVSNALKQEQKVKRINSFDFFKVETIDEQHIWMAYHNYAEFKGQDNKSVKRQWLENILAVRTEKGWKLKMMHSTRVNI